MSMCNIVMRVEGRLTQKGEIANMASISEMAKSPEVLMQLSMEVVGDLGTGGMGTAIDSMTVSCPEDLQCHCMPSLKAEPITPAEKT